MKAVRAEGARKSYRKYFIGFIETIRCFQGNARIFPFRKVFYGPMFSSKSLVESLDMVVVAQLVRASVCGTEGRGFESRHPPFSFNGVTNGKAYLPAVVRCGD